MHVVFFSQWSMVPDLTPYCQRGYLAVFSPVADIQQGAEIGLKTTCEQLYAFLQFSRLLLRSIRMFFKGESTKWSSCNDSHACLTCLREPGVHTSLYTMYMGIHMKEEAPMTKPTVMLQSGNL